MTPSERLRIACICGLTQWVLAAAIQMGDFFGYLLPPAGRNLEAATFLFTVFPFIQAQNALVAWGFGLVAYFAVRNRVTAWVWFAVCTLESVGLILDQVYYKIFLDHVHFGMFEWGRQFNAAITLGSFRSELDWIGYCAAAIAVAGAVWLASALLIPPGRPRKAHRVLEIAAALALIGIPAFASKKYVHVNEHPLVALAQELRQGSLVKALARRAGTVHGPVVYKSEAPPDRDPRLAAMLSASHARHPYPNLVLIVLESVGAVNALGPDGLPVRTITPNLALLAQNGVTFNSVYTSFPGTTRSLISLHTGGQQLTYGGMDELVPRYEGPLLAREIDRLGYVTAFFSSERMDGEGTDLFLQQAGYQKYYDFSKDLAGHEKYQITSWGVREEYALGLMEDWIGHAQSGGKPFFLEFMNAATHHPYGAPPGYRMPFATHDRKSDYLNALYYTDLAIGSLLDFLEKRGLLKDTIVAVTGDHGEAFGDLHANNFLHKNFSYDENVREFLLLSDGQLAGRKPVESPLVSSRVARNGDIMPTLLALLDAPAAPVPGRNLLVETFESRPVYFHKLAPPETFGLRDGRWKYIGEIRSDADELYDLAADPTEQVNLAASQPQRVAEYREMCRQWFLESESEYTLRLKDYHGPQPGPDTGDGRLGARILAVGYWDSVDRGDFLETSLLDPTHRPVAWAKWATDPEPRSQYEWISPAGQALISPLVRSPEWHVTYSPFPGAMPMQEGEWSLRLRENGDVHLAMSFTVRAGAAQPGEGR